MYTIPDNASFYLPPIFEKRREVLFWAPLPSLPTFFFISRLLLKLAFLNLTCAIYANTILLKCFKFFPKFKIGDLK